MLPHVYEYVMLYILYCIVMYQLHTSYILYIYPFYVLLSLLDVNIIYTDLYFIMYTSYTIVYRKLKCSDNK